MLIKVNGHNENREIKIELVTVDYLKQVANYFYENNILDYLYQLLNGLVIDISKINNFSIILSIINSITNYTDGESSNSIENININFKSEQINKINFNKIHTYINQINKINFNNGIVNNEVIEEFHNCIEQTKEKILEKTLINM